MMTTCLLPVVQGRRVYYHRIVVEANDGPKEAILVKCGWMPHQPAANDGGNKSRPKRQDELSPDFREAE